MEVRTGDPARGEGRSEEAGARGTGAALESIKRVAAVTGAASGSLARPQGHWRGLGVTGVDYSACYVAERLCGDGAPPAMGVLAHGTLLSPAMRAGPEERPAAGWKKHLGVEGAEGQVQRHEIAAAPRYYDHLPQRPGLASRLRLGPTGRPASVKYAREFCRCNCRRPRDE